MQSRFEKRGTIGILWVDNPPVNAINRAVRTGLIDGIRRLNADPELQAGIIACAGRTFMAGADITEFGKPLAGPTLPETLEVIESSTKPVLAAIHGTALGGGLETALACDYRLATSTAKVGLPEVKLGLLPGAGGTQRLPRLIGIEAALRLIVTGDPLPAPHALTLGIIDKIIAEDLIDGAVAYAQELLTVQLRKIRNLTVDVTTLAPGYFDEARKRLRRERKNLHAPQRIVDALEAAATVSFDAGLKRERELFLDSRADPQAKALQHVFFAERKAASVAGSDSQAARRSIERVAVIGAGTMGGGIAMNFLNAGFPVALLETQQQFLTRGVDAIRKNYAGSAAKGRLSPQDVEKRMALLKPTLSYADLSDADLVIEAVFETLAVKREVFATLDGAAKPGAILASNTSYLSIDQIAAATSRPDDVLGMHFFSPASVMKLVEIVRGEHTAPDVLATVAELAKRIGKTGVVCGNQDGFIGNRMLQEYRYQALLMVMEGALPEQVDAALRDFGMPMGVFQMSDLAGLDIGYQSRRDRDPNSYDRRVYRSADQLVELGRLGQKTHAGYYDYDDRTPKPSPIVREILERASDELGIPRRSFTDEEIIERCFLALMNAGCEVLREGVAARAGDIDVVYINGYGFPAYRGGPMYWAEHEVGLPRALETLERLAAEQKSPFFKVSAFLEQRVAHGQGFAAQSST